MIGAFHKSIPTNNLLLHLSNSRLPEVQKNQRAAIRTMVERERKQMLALAAHLANHRTNPADFLIVVPMRRTDDEYTVYDGNRRLTAIRILESPNIVDDIITVSEMRALRAVSSQFSSNPIIDLNCAVFDRREEAMFWVELTHDGQSNGAGRVKWDSQMKHWHYEREGHNVPEKQILDFVMKHGQISKSTREKIEKGKYPVTTLTRLMNTPAVREILGISRKDGNILTQFPREEIAKSLSKAVEDVGRKPGFTRQLNKQSERIRYAQSFSSNDIPEASTDLKSERLLEEAPEEKPKKRRRKSLKSSYQRPRLIPAEFDLQFDRGRIKDIYIELQRDIELKTTPNAAAVLLRVLIEFCLDDFIEATNMIGVTTDSKLSHKVNSVADEFERRGVMTKSALRPIRKASSENVTAASVMSLHAYVHNKNFFPAQFDLAAAWDSWQHFIEKLQQETLVAK